MKRNNIHSIIISMIGILVLGLTKAVAYDHYASEDNLRSPNASELEFYSEIPLSYHTGTPDISVSIYKSKVCNVPLDISLHYNSSGIKLNQLPGWTGHSWIMMAGGCITRIQGGPKDETDEGSISNYFRNCTNITSYPYDGSQSQKVGFIDDIERDGSDLVPDIFVFNFMGKQGRFFMGNDGKWKVDSKDNLTVIFNQYSEANYTRLFDFYPGTNRRQTKNIKGFTIVDDNGTQYVFGNKGGVPTKNEPVEYWFGYNHIPDRKSWNANSWFLSEVRDRNGILIYDFQYERGPFISQITPHFEIVWSRIHYDYYWENKTSMQYLVNSSNFPYSSVILSPVYLSKITTFNGDVIEFKLENGFSTDEVAYPNLKKYYPDLFVSKEKLRPDVDRSKPYVYLQKNDYKDYWYDYSPQKEYKEPWNATGLLRLKQIVVCHGASSETHDFIYNSNKPLMHLTSIIKNIGKTEEKYVFKYDGWDKLPKDYLCLSVDHWGFFNESNINDNTLSALIGYGTVNYPYSAGWNNLLDLKKSNAESTQFGLLTSIQYPTGGFEKITYEHNRVDSYLSDNRQSVIREDNLDCGGCRVVSINTYSDSTCTVLLRGRSFRYEEGEMFCKPKYTWKDWHPQIHYADKNSTVNFYSLTSLNQSPVEYNPIVGYGKVTEMNSDGSSNVYSYSNYSSATAGFDDPYIPFASKYELSPYDQFVNKGFGRGNLLSLKKMDKNGNPVYELKNEYRKDSSFVKDCVLFPVWVRVMGPKSKDGVTGGMHYTSWYAGGVSKFYYPKYDIDRTIESFYEGDKIVTKETNYERFDREGKRYVRNEIVKWNAGRHTDDHKTETRTTYNYAFDDFGEIKPQNIPVTATGLDASHQLYVDTFYIDAFGGYQVEYRWVVYVSQDPDKDIFGTGQTQIERGKPYSCVIKHWVNGVLTDIGTISYDPTYDVDPEPEEERPYVDEGNTESITLCPILDNQELFVAKNFFPIVRKTVFQNDVELGSQITSYFSEGKKLYPSVVCSKQNGEILDYTKFLEYNENGLPTKIKKKGVPSTYLFWEKANLVATVTSGISDALPEYKKTSNPLQSVSINGQPAFLCPTTTAQVATYNENNMMSSLTVGNGVTQYFEYDNTGRLIATKNGQQQLKSKDEYHIQENGYNYIVHTEVLDAQNRDNSISVQYYDALGRKSLSATNSTDPQGRFLYSLNEYDLRGRNIRNWLPVPQGTTLDPTIISGFASASASFYGDNYAFSASEYDEFGRVTKTTKTGKAWHDGKKHSTAKYGFNSSRDVKCYSSTVKDNSLSYTYYKEGDLSSVTAMDEDKHKMVIYKDSRDLTILERKFCNGETVETYYVYDDMGRISWILQPEYQVENNLDKYAFHYEYTPKNQILKKKLPGCEPITYSYDEYGRMVTMQDGVLRKRNLYRYMFYDRLGRVCIQGTCVGKDSHEPYMPICVRTEEGFGGIGYDLIDCYENEPTFSPNKYNPVIFFEQFAEDFQFEIVNYYDDYSILNSDKVLSNMFQESEPGSNLTVSKQWASNGEILLLAYTYDEFGRVSRKGSVGLDKHLTVTDYTYNFFDAVISETSSEYDLVDGVYNKTYTAFTQNKYDIPHTKLLSSSVITINDLANNVIMTDTIHKPTYDEFGRIVANDRNGIAADMLYEYDKLHGWLTSVKGGMFVGDYQFNQKLYRESGSANPMWNGSISAMEWRTILSDHHRYDYKYDELNRLIGAEYSDMNQAKSSDIGRATLSISLLRDGEEDSSEDIAHNLVTASAVHVEQSDYGEIIEYDKNSNVKFMQRSGFRPKVGLTVLDELSFAYNGNQRKKVVDVAGYETFNNASDFVDAKDLDVEYMYDGNGNLTWDANKGMKFQYDLLGNLISVEGDKCSIEYVYSADGRKLRVIHNQYADVNRKMRKTTTRTDYYGRLIYTDGMFAEYRFDGGYYAGDKSKNGKLFRRYYYCNDYQGNVRLLIAQDKLFQRNNYYPYGSEIWKMEVSPERQNYKYSGKELDRTFGLDLYDFHARQYDPMLGCFNGVDPFGEQSPQYSLYSYCGGDPVNYVDKSGNERYAVNSMGYIIFDSFDGNDYITLYQSNDPRKTYVVPQELNSVVKTMIEFKINPKKGFEKGNFTKTTTGCKYNNRVTHWSITTSPKVYELYDWLVGSSKNFGGVEWRVDSYGSILGDFFIIATQHSDNPQKGVDHSDGLMTSGEKERLGIYKKTNCHNHLLDGTQGASDYNGQGDMDVCKDDTSVDYFVLVPQAGDKPNLLIKYSNIDGVKKNEPIYGGFSPENLAIYFGIKF